MALFINAPPVEPPSQGLFEAIGGLIAKVPDIVVSVGERAGDILEQQEISKQIRESRDQVFILALVLGGLFLLTRN